MAGAAGAGAEKNVFRIIRELFENNKLSQIEKCDKSDDGDESSQSTL